jgi:hypothetical protein
MSTLNKNSLRTMYKTLDYGDEAVPEADREKIGQEISTLYESIRDKSSSQGTTTKMMLDMLGNPKYKIRQVVSTMLGVIGELVGWNIGGRRRKTKKRRVTKRRK